jgi:hypothetical protein
MLAGLAGHGASLIFFETAPRVAAALADIAEVLGDPPVALARELTKFHEEVLRGTASEVAAAIAARGGVKGEITLVVAPPEPAGTVDEREVDEALAAALDEMSPGKAASLLARQFGPAAARPLPARPGAERRRRCRRRLSAGRRFAAATLPRRGRMAAALQGLSHRGPAGAHAAGRDRPDRAARGHACLRRGQGAPDRDAALEAVSPRQARRLVAAARYWLSLQPPATASRKSATGALTSSSSRHTCCRAISPTPSAPTCGNTMTLNTAVQMDPIGQINVAGDSTFALMLEAQARGHRQFYYEPKTLALRDGRLMASGCDVTVRDEPGNHAT